ncbi:hypothetical protein B0H14DRAFT_2565091 [Mycena olivaceomarginata]|nr:hypothetical protein B0H14DRAFT_2565091 [Mycena olivaceomarginata]
MAKRKKPMNKEPRTAEALERSKEKARLRKARYRWQVPSHVSTVSQLTEEYAAIKASRRQWDPPKKPPNESLPHAAHSSPDALLPQNPALTHNGRGLLTLAEESAVSALLDLATIQHHATSIHPQIPRTNPVLSDFSRNSSPSLPSSLQSVFEQRVVTPPTPDDDLYSTIPLPPYASPPTPLQNQHWHDMGLIGPITGVQHVQILAAHLGDPPSDNEGETELFRSTYRTLSTERSDRIRSWLAQHQPYEELYELQPHGPALDRQARRAALELWVNQRARA